jgi:dynein heavy chain
MEKGLPPNKLVPKLRAAVDEYRLLLPVVSALRNKSLKERHWAKVFAAIGTTLPRDETFTLQVTDMTDVMHDSSVTSSN